MNAISSFKPFSEDKEYAKLQKEAFDSWYPHFGKIVYYGDREPLLLTEKTIFVKSEQFPKIKDLVRMCALSISDYTCLINSDIILKPGFSQIVHGLKEKNLVAAISRRYQMDEGTDGKLVDYGLDVFIARPMFWSKVYGSIPDNLRIGHNNWDTWMAGFFNRNLKGKAADFTHRKLVFHPKHGGRARPYESLVHTKDHYLNYAALPATKL